MVANHSSGRILAINRHKRTAGYLTKGIGRRIAY